MGTCKKCSTPIAMGRSYCDAHFNEAMMVYNQQLAQYEQDLAYWESLSDEEKAHYHHQAETVSVMLYAICVGAIIGGSIWYSLNGVIDNLFGLIILLISVFITSWIRPIRVFVGRFARTILKGGILFLIFAFITAILGEFSDLLKPYVDEYFSKILLFEFFGALILSIFFEITGGHHASGAPCPPDKPVP